MAEYYTRRRGGIRVDIQDLTFLSAMKNGWRVWEQPADGGERKELQFLKREKRFVTPRVFQAERNYQPESELPSISGRDVVRNGHSFVGRRCSA